MTTRDVNPETGEILGPAAAHKCLAECSTSLNGVHMELWSDEDLLQNYEHARGVTEFWRTQAGHVEQELFRRMDARGATSIPSETFVCEERVKVDYDQTAFTPLKEVITIVADLDKCWTPAHEEVVQVPEHWASATTIKAVARRYGDKALAIMERAKQSKRTGIKFERRQPDGK